MSTATRTRPTAPLPPAAVSAIARIERALAPVAAEQHRVERLVAGLRIGESTVINGSSVTAISLAVADLLDRHAVASSRCRRLSAAATSERDFEQLLGVQDELSLCRCQLDAAGMLDLIEAA